MSTFAENTDVPVERSRMEIERTLMRYGASSFGYVWDQESAEVAFEAKGKRIRFTLTMPEMERFAHTPNRGTRRSQKAMLSAHDQECRRRWRALHLVIKAKLEAVESGITTFEKEFLPFIVLPNGNTVGDELVPRIEEIYLKGLPPGLIALKAPGAAQ